MNKLLFAALLGLVIAGTAEAFPRLGSQVTRVTRNDGDSNLPFAITCLESAWTSVGSTSKTAVGTGASRLRRRAMTVQTLATVTYAVCLSTTSASGDTCADGRAGYELGSAWGSVSIYDEAIWYCRTRAGGSTAIKGVEHFDGRDELVP